MLRSDSGRVGRCTVRLSVHETTQDFEFYTKLKVQVGSVRPRWTKHKVINSLRGPIDCLKIFKSLQETKFFTFFMLQLQNCMIFQNVMQQTNIKLVIIANWKESNT